MTCHTSPHNTTSSTPVSSFPCTFHKTTSNQILAGSLPSGDVADQQHPVHRLAAAPPLPLHVHLRAAGDAGVRGQVQLRSGEAQGKFRYLLPEFTDRVSGNFDVVFLLLFLRLFHSSTSPPLSSRKSGHINHLPPSTHIYYHCSSPSPPHCLCPLASTSRRVLLHFCLHSFAHSPSQIINREKNSLMTAWQQALKMHLRQNVFFLQSVSVPNTKRLEYCI